MSSTKNKMSKREHHDDDETRVVADYYDYKSPWTRLGSYVKQKWNRSEAAVVYHNLKTRDDPNSGSGATALMNLTQSPTFTNASDLGFIHGRYYGDEEIRELEEVDITTMIVHLVNGMFIGGSFGSHIANEKIKDSYSARVIEKNSPVYITCGINDSQAFLEAFIEHNTCSMMIIRAHLIHPEQVWDTKHSYFISCRRDKAGWLIFGGQPGEKVLSVLHGPMASNIKRFLFEKEGRELLTARLDCAFGSKGMLTLPENDFLVMPKIQLGGGHNIGAEPGAGYSGISGWELIPNRHSHFEGVHAVIDVEQDPDLLEELFLPDKEE